MDYLSNLPNEILLEIFGYCRIVSLTCVCKKFNELISNTPSLMRKVNLKLMDGGTSASEMTKSKRQHQAIHFKFNYRIREDSLQLLNHFRGIKTLEFIRCIIQFDLFEQLLRAVEHLETISINVTYLKEKDKTEARPPRLSKLKYLIFKNSDADFLQFFRNAQLERVSIQFPTQYPLTILEDFLRLQPNIKIIDSLCATSIQDLLMTIVTQELKSLQKLYLNVARMNLETIKYLDLKNNSVRFLSLSGNSTDDDGVLIALAFFKQLMTLEIEFNTYLNADRMVQIQEQTPKLQSLYITQCQGDFFNRIQLRDLKHLHLEDYPSNVSIGDWTALANRNPFIEKLVLKNISLTDEVFKTICNEFGNLKHLELIYNRLSDNQMTAEVLNFVCDPNFPSNIRFLKIPRFFAGEDDSLLTDEQKNVLNTNKGFKFILS